MTAERVFFDTLTFVAGLVASQAPHARIFDFPSDRFQLLVSDAMFTEVLDVVRRSTTFARLYPAASKISLQDIFATMDSEIPSLPPSMKLNICKEEADNKFLSSAIYLECDWLVTGVPDLLQLESRPKWLQFKEKNGVPLRIIDAARFVGMFP